MSEDNRAIAVLGPTASGKSLLAVELAIAFKGEIVGCDALQIYRRMNIGTAKIPPAERRGVAHHLLDVKDPSEVFSAGDYQNLARKAIRSIHSRNRLPIVAGGTGFYLRALIDGLFEGPDRSEALRIRMRRIIDRKGSPILHRALSHIDPESAAKISERDAERIIRAYEIYLISGKTMSGWQSQPRNRLRGVRWLKIGIDLPRDLLFERINRRVILMFEGGLLEEVRELLSLYALTCQAFKAIGYRQAAAHLTGDLSLAQAIESTQQESRRYAKRQLTWFRADREVLWLDGRLGAAELATAASSAAARFLNR